MLDVIGTNDRNKELLDACKDKSGRKIVGTEQGHERSTSLACRDNPQHSGQFLWCGADHLGQSRSWPRAVYNAGLLDRAGFVQPRGHERQSWWSDKLMVRIFRRVGFTASTTTDPGYEALEWQRRQVLFPDGNPSSSELHEKTVEIYRNSEEVELFRNGQSLGKNATRQDGAAINRQIIYQPGTLKTVATSNGKEVATDIVRTAGKPVKIVLIPDRKSITTRFDDDSNNPGSPEIDWVAPQDVAGVLPRCRARWSFQSRRDGKCRVHGLPNGTRRLHSATCLPSPARFCNPSKNTPQRCSAC